MNSFAGVSVGVFFGGGSSRHIPAIIFDNIGKVLYVIYLSTEIISIF